MLSWFENKVEMEMYSAPPGNYISKIFVDQLYGDFSYQIGPVVEGADPRVLILYGSNGTGKSTILLLLRSLLSPSNTSGHRARLTRIPFKRFEVEFQSGMRVGAARDKASVGPYLLSMVGGGEGAAIRIFVKIEPDGSVRNQNWPREDQEKFSEFLRRLESISREVTFLDDKRTFYKQNQDERQRILAYAKREIIEGASVSFSDQEGGDPVSATVEALVDSIRREVLLRQRRGSDDSQSIYQSLISTFARGGSIVSPSIDQLTQRLQLAEAVSQELAAMGFVAPLNSGDVVKQLSQVSSERKDFVMDLVDAYVKSTEARFDALKEIKGLLDIFVDRLNWFMPEKKASFTVGEGLSIRSRAGRKLSISVLSSGERQLVMMLTQALLRRSESALIIIDEPELSLNMKWQRELVAAILQCLGGGGSQVIFATHSIEIAARYRKNVVRLWAQGESQDEKDDR